MLTGNFENKKRIVISGDVLDLTTLKNTIQKTIELVDAYEVSNTDISKLFRHFFVRLEKALCAQGLMDQRCIGELKLVYFGFNSSWMELLILNNLLQGLSVYLVRDELDEINIMLLGYLCKQGIPEDKKRDASAISHHIHNSFSFTNIKQFINHFKCSVVYAFEKEKETVNEMVELLSPNRESLMVRI